ncbi:MAG: ATP-binding protein, partial [Acidobacteriota bacterium]
GRAAVTGQIQFASGLDSRHDVSYEGMKEHGHYCVPIMLEDRPLGVLNLYLARDHARRPDEEAFITSIAHLLALIVQRAHAEEALVGKEAELREAHKLEAMGQLAAGVAHDFNNVLQAMMSTTPILRYRRDDQTRCEAAVGELENQIRRGANLTQQLLLFARRKGAKRELFDLNEMVSGSMKMMQRLLRENIAFRFEPAPVPLPIEADRGQLDQVLLNLVVNAGDAMREGGRLLVRTGRADDCAWLEVKDSGTGIPAEVRERIFEPFFTTKETGKGTGLGLAVSQGIVVSHGGRIALESVVGAGTTFRVELPLRPGDATPPAAPAQPLSEEPPTGHGERILIVEDEDGAREGLREMLGLLGYQIATASSGEEAGLLPPVPAFDVLLTDLVLPGIRGDDLARGLRDRWPGLSVILMSGYTEDEVFRGGVVASNVRFLQKPFGMTALARELRVALDERQGR